MEALPPRAGCLLLICRPLPQELCDDLVDELGANFVKVMEQGESWQAMQKLMCGTLTSNCKSAEDFKDEL